MRKKKSKLNIDKKMAEKIPYRCCYQEEGMIETRRGVFTKAYLIGDINPDNIIDYDNSMVLRKISSFVNSLPEDVEFQFCIHNKMIKQEEFLKKVLVRPDKAPEINKYIEAYNRVVIENASIGHNNVKATRYFVLALKDQLPESAAERFKSIDPLIKRSFKAICGIEVSELSLPKRLRIMYSMLNPGKNDFGIKADLIGDGRFSFENMKKMKLTTKDMVAPDFLIEEKNHLIINHDTYVRVFFISTVPTYVSNNLISDLTNINSNMLFSMQNEAFDTMLGFETASKRVADNTVILNLKKRETIKDRKNKATIRQESSKECNERTYFDKEALKEFKNAMASDNREFASSFIMAIFAEDLEGLERDTKLIHISISKFACQIKSLSMQQLKGFQSVLPLCTCRVDVKRVFSSEKLASLAPLNIQEVYRKDGLYNGLNAINDNLVLYNRKNSGNMAGIIAGVETSGKTFQCKREIFNALIGTNDRVIILSSNNDYDGFVKKLGGRKIPVIVTNPFHVEKGYGLMDPDRYTKSFFLEALVASALERESYIKDELDKLDFEIEAEVKELLNARDDKLVDFEDQDGMVTYLREKQDIYPLFNEMLFLPVFDNLGKTLSGDDRLELCQVSNPVETCIMLDYIWNRVIKDLKRDISTWVFVDNIDPIISISQGSEYIQEFIGKCNSLKIVFTCVIQSTVRLLARDVSGMYLDEIVGVCGYYKLLNQGAIERKKYTELLTIPSSLLEHITNREPGKGIVITSASNTAFDDSFLGESGEFLELFK